MQKKEKEKEEKTTGNFYLKSIINNIPKFFWNVVKHTFIFLILFTIGIYFLMQLPSFQNYAAKKATEFLSKELKSEVSVGRIRITFFQSVVIEDLLVRDRQQDTLLNIGQLKATLDGGFFDLLDGKINITSAYIKDLKGHLVKTCPDFNNNYQFLINYFENGHPDSLFSRPSGKKTAIKLNFKDIDLRKVSFDYTDKYVGKKLFASFDRLSTDFNEFSIDSNLFLLNKLNIDLPIFYIEKIKPEKCNVLHLEDPYAALIAEQRKKRPPKPDLHVEAQYISIEEGKFSFHDYRWPPIKAHNGKVLDFSNIDLNNINIGLESVIFDGKTVSASLSQLAVKTGTPFNINDFNADRVSYSPNEISIEKFALTTDNSHLEDSLRLSYQDMEDFQDYVNKVKMTGHFTNSQVSVKDIMVFDPKLSNIDFLIKNKNNDLHLEGNIYGTVNNLRGKQAKISIGNYMTLESNFSLQDITKIDEATLNLSVHSLKTNANGLENIIPDFKAPKELYKLGNITYSGKLDGFILDFVTYGKLKSSQGNGNLDLHLNIRDGIKNAKYSGLLQLDKVNVGNIIDNPDFGTLSASIAIKDGKSFLPESITSQLSSNIQSFTYKGYNYTNLIIDGKLDKNTFDGKLKAIDPNMDLNFNGKIDFSKKIKVFDFDMDVRNLNLSKLKLADLAIQIKGKVKSQLTFSDLSDMNGFFSAKNLSIRDTSGHHLDLDTLQFVAVNLGQGKKDYTLHSDLADLKLTGKFQIENLINDLTKVFHYNHPKLANQLGIQSSKKSVFNNDFNFSIQLKNSKDAFIVFNLPIEPITNSTFAGVFSNTDSTLYRLNINAGIPSLKGEGFAFNYLYFEGLGNQDNSEFFAYANSGNLFGKELNQMDISATLERDSIFYFIKTPQVENIIKNINIDGLYTVDDGYNIIKFQQSKFDFLDDGWTLNKDNFIKFGKHELFIRNLEMTNGKQNISFNSYGPQGLEINVKNFDAKLLDSLLVNQDLKIRGIGDFNLKIDSVFTQENIALTSHFDSILINDTHMGALNLDANAQSLKQKIGFDIDIGSQDKKFNLTGLYTMPGYNAFDYPPEYLDLLVNAENYPLEIADIFLGDLIKDTRGTFMSNFRLRGKTNQLSMNGNIQVHNMATTVRYLGTRYYIPSYNSRLTNNLIDLEGLVLLDERGNTAIVSGGLLHNKFNHLNADIEISSDNFLLLKTNEKDNPNYYGTASGKFNGRFKGPLNQLNIDIDATTGTGTEFFMPVASSKEIDALTFIEFKNRFDTAVQKDINRVVTSTGLSIKINAELNEKATLNLIIDKQTGDIIKAQGNGILEISIPRNGNLSLFGGYEVTSGEYRLNLIPLYNLSIFGAKFLIKKGGTLIWNGDPINAQVNIDAEFRGVNTSPYNFISEYIPEGDLKVQAEASRPTPVDLTLNLRGDLLKPDITFKIDFPQISPELKTYVDSKLRALEQDPNELYKQAASLISFGSFIPKDNFNLSAVTATAYNTLSDLISNQLTQILSPMLTAAVADGKVLTGVDLNLNYNFYEANTTQGAGIQNRIGSELLIGPSLKFFNDRLIVNTGVKSGEQGRNQNYVAGEADLQYYLSADKRYILRIYQNNDAVLEGRRIKSGVGISFRRSMDSFAELFQRNKKKRAKSK